MMISTIYLYFFEYLLDRNSSSFVPPDPGSHGHAIGAIFSVIDDGWLLLGDNDGGVSTLLSLQKLTDD